MPENFETYCTNMELHSVDFCYYTVGWLVHDDLITTGIMSPGLISLTLKINIDIERDQGGSFKFTLSGNDFGNDGSHLFYILVDGSEIFRADNDFDLDDHEIEFKKGYHSVFFILEKDVIESDEDTGNAEGAPYVDFLAYTMTGSSVGGAIKCTNC